MRRVDGGWTLIGSGHLEPPLDLTTTRLEIRYDGELAADRVDARRGDPGCDGLPAHDFADGKAASELNQSGAVTHKTDPVAPDTLVLPNLFFGSYEALALRLASVPDGGSFKAYIAPQAEITVKQNARSSQRIETAKRVVDVRTYALTFQNPGSPLDATVWTDESGPPGSLRGRRAVAADGPRRLRVGLLARAGDEPRRAIRRVSIPSTASTWLERSASRRARRRWMRRDGIRRSS